MRVKTTDPDGERREKRHYKRAVGHHKRVCSGRRGKGTKMPRRDGLLFSYWKSRNYCHWLVANKLALHLLYPMRQETPVLLQETKARKKEPLLTLRRTAQSDFRLKSPKKHISRSPLLRGLTRRGEPNHPTCSSQRQPKTLINHGRGLKSLRSQMAEPTSFRSPCSKNLKVAGISESRQYQTKSGALEPIRYKTKRQGACVPSPPPPPRFESRKGASPLS